eukprot:gnl/Trimastix_PCT/1720.p1 GENE.gnl/Trimastix_PCT/1720~~gnl/Trimastix_PCT/1720.p1  ORF type:complete len:707 (+),score=201.34 gnl/Trimastix_PCT/1720:58-2178(+)
MSLQSEARQYPNAATGYRLISEIGHGASAVVWRAICLPNQEEVAVKILDLEQFSSSMDEIRKEIQVMALCSHPNVIRLHVTFVHETSLWLVMPLLAGSCLDIMRILELEGLSEVLIATILKQTLMALDYFHQQGQIHRDIKAGNILIDTRGNVRLADFGVSGFLLENGFRRHNRHTLVGTPCWMAPEVVDQSQGYDTKADIWSFGITALELAAGRAPLAQYETMKILVMTLQNPPPSADDLPHASRFSRAFKDLCALCLQKDSAKRPSASKLLEHRFFRGAKKPEYLVANLTSRLPAWPDRPKSQGPDAAALASRMESEAGPASGSSWDFSGVQTKETPASAVAPAAIAAAIAYPAPVTPPDTPPVTPAVTPVAADTATGAALVAPAAPAHTTAHPPPPPPPPDTPPTGATGARPISPLAVPRPPATSPVAVAVAAAHPPQPLSAQTPPAHPAAAAPAAPHAFASATPTPTALTPLPSPAFTPQAPADRIARSPPSQPLRPHGAATPAHGEASTGAAPASGERKVEKKGRFTSRTIDNGPIAPGASAVPLPAPDDGGSLRRFVSPGIGIRPGTKDLRRPAGKEGEAAEAQGPLVTRIDPLAILSDLQAQIKLLLRDNEELRRHNDDLRLQNVMLRNHLKLPLTPQQQALLAQAQAHHPHPQHAHPQHQGTPPTPATPTVLSHTHTHTQQARPPRQGAPRAANGTGR